MKSKLSLIISSDTLFLKRKSQYTEFNKNLTLLKFGKIQDTAKIKNKTGKHEDAANKLKTNS